MKKAIFILIISFILFIVSANKDYVISGLLSFAIATCSFVYLIYLGVKKIRKATNSKATNSVVIEVPISQLCPSVSISVSNSNDGTYYTKIAGVQHHCNKQDIGGFLGYICSEPNNQYDKNAVAVYRNDNRLLGYLPKDEIKDFREWSEKENLPCVGFIKAGDEVPLFGKVKITDTDKDETDLIVARYVKWLVSNFGAKFIPAGFSVGAGKELRTKTDWIDFLDGYIEEKEAELYEET